MFTAWGIFIAFCLFCLAAVIALVFYLGYEARRRDEEHERRQRETMPPRPRRVVFDQEVEARIPTCSREDCEAPLSTIESVAETVLVGAPGNVTAGYGVGEFDEIVVAHHVTETCEAGHVETRRERPKLEAVNA